MPFYQVHIHNCGDFINAQINQAISFNFLDEILAIEAAWDLSSRSSVSAPSRLCRPIPALAPPSDSEDDVEDQDGPFPRSKESVVLTQPQASTSREVISSSTIVNKPTVIDTRTVIDNVQASISEDRIQNLVHSIRRSTALVPSIESLDPRVTRLEVELLLAIPRHLQLSVLAQRPPKDLSESEIIQHYGCQAKYEEAKAEWVPFIRKLLTTFQTLRLIPSTSIYYEDSDKHQKRGGRKRKTPSTTRVPSPPRQRAELQGPSPPPSVILGELRLECQNFLFLFLHVSLYFLFLDDNGVPHHLFVRMGKDCSLPCMVPVSSTSTGIDTVSTVIDSAANQPESVIDTGGSILRGNLHYVI